jgi:hypothetical protein
MRLYTELSALPVEQLRAIAQIVLGEQPPELENALPEVRVSELLRRCEGDLLDWLDYAAKTVVAQTAGGAG